jgi:hypothetical protein
MSGLETQLACWFYAFVFAAAVQHKLTNWTRFRASVGAYDIVPEPLLSAFTGLLSFAEVVVVMSLFLLQPAGMILAGILLTIYMIAMAINMVRGRRFIDCGCGDEPSPLSAALMIRNLILILVAIGTCYAGVWAGYKDITSSLVASSMAIVAAGLYFTLDQLLANQGKYRRLWLGDI